MSPLDIVALPGHKGMFARHVAVEAWQAAGSPRVNSAGRLYAEQKRLYDGWRLRKPGFQPADNPDDETQRLAHVRFVAFDIDATADRIKRLTVAGFVRPYSYEPWHWELPNVRSYGIVRSIPATAGGNVTPIVEPLTTQENTTMATAYATKVPAGVPQSDLDYLGGLVSSGPLIVRTGIGIYALCGDSPGTRANVQLTQLDALGNAWAADHTGHLEKDRDGLNLGKGVRWLEWSHFIATVRAYLSPVAGSVAFDYAEFAKVVALAVAANPPAHTPAQIAKAVNDDAAERLRN